MAVEPVTAVYASTAVRAQQTAAPLAARLGLSVEVVDGVHEVFCGDLEGRADEAAREMFDEVYTAWADGDLGRRLPGGESAIELRERFLPLSPTCGPGTPLRRTAYWCWSATVRRSGWRPAR